MKILKLTSFLTVVGYSLMSIFLLASLIPSPGNFLSLDFLMELPKQAGKEGGILPIIIGTFVIWSLSLAVSFVMGLSTAIFSFEISQKHKRLYRWILLAIYSITGIPSIVFGLLGNRIFVVEFAWGYSMLAGIATISLMMFPLVCLCLIQAFEQIDPNIYRNSVSLSISKFKIYKSILLPFVQPSIYAGLSLASARVLAETAALLFTAGYSYRMPSSLMDSSRSLSVHIYDLMTNVVGGGPMANKTAFLLFVMILFIQIILYFLFKPTKEKSYV